jgi:phage-related protein
MTLANVLSGFVGLGAVGSTYLPAIGTAIDGVSARFKAWVDSGVEDGSIKRMIDGAIEGFRQLGDLIGAVGSAVAVLAQGINAGLGAGATPLTMLTEKVNIFKAALETPQAQEALRLIGEAIAACSAAFGAVLPVVIEFATTLATMLLPAVIGLAGLITEWPTTFVAVAAALIGVVAGVKLLLGVATLVRTAIMAWTIAQTALNFVLAMNPIGLIVIAIGLLVAALVLAWQNSETFRNIVTGAWEAVLGVITGAIDWITSAVPAAWNAVTAAAGSAWDAHVRWVASGVQRVVAFVQGLPGKLLGILGNIGNLLVSSGRALIDGFWSGIKSVWSGLVSWFQSQLAWFRGLWPFSPAKWGPFSGTGYVTYSGKALVGDFKDSLAAGIPAVGRAASDLMGAAAGPLGGMGNSVTWGQVDEGTWNQLRAAGWKGRAGDGTERLYRPAGASASGGSMGGTTVHFSGNTSDALATVIMGLIRTGKIQIRTTTGNDIRLGA